MSRTFTSNKQQQQQQQQQTTSYYTENRYVNSRYKYVGGSGRYKTLINSSTAPPTPSKITKTNLKLLPFESTIDLTTTTVDNNLDNIIKFDKQIFRSNFILREFLRNSHITANYSTNFPIYENLCRGCGYGLFDSQGNLCKFCQYIINGYLQEKTTEISTKDRKKIEKNIENIYENLCEKCGKIQIDGVCPQCCRLIDCGEKKGKSKKFFHGIIDTLKRAKSKGSGDSQDQTAKKILSNTTSSLSSLLSLSASQVGPKKLQIIHNVDGYDNVFRTQDTFDLQKICELKNTQSKKNTGKEGLYGKLKKSNDNLIDSQGVKTLLRNKKFLEKYSNSLEKRVRRSKSASQIANISKLELNEKSKGINYYQRLCKEDYPLPFKIPRCTIEWMTSLRYEIIDYQCTDSINSTKTIPSRNYCDCCSSNCHIKQITSPTSSYCSFNFTNLSNNNYNNNNDQSSATSSIVVAEKPEYLNFNIINNKNIVFGSKLSTTTTSQYSLLINSLPVDSIIIDETTSCLSEQYIQEQYMIEEFKRNIMDKKEQQLQRKQQQQSHENQQHKHLYRRHQPTTELENKEREKYYETLRSKRKAIYLNEQQQSYNNDSNNINSNNNNNNNSDSESLIENIFNKNYENNISAQCELDVIVNSSENILRNKGGALLSTNPNRNGICENTIIKPADSKLLRDLLIEFDKFLLNKNIIDGDDIISREITTNNTNYINLESIDSEVNSNKLDFDLTESHDQSLDNKISDYYCQGINCSGADNDVLVVTSNINPIFLKHINLKNLIISITLSKCLNKIIISYDKNLCTFFKLIENSEYYKNLNCNELLKWFKNFNCILIKNNKRQKLRMKKEILPNVANKISENIVKTENTFINKTLSFSSKDYSNNNTDMNNTIKNTSTSENCNNDDENIPFIDEELSKRRSNNFENIYVNLHESEIKNEINTDQMIVENDKIVEKEQKNVNLIDLNKVTLPVVNQLSAKMIEESNTLLIASSSDISSNTDSMKSTKSKNINRYGKVFQYSDEQEPQYGKILKARNENNLKNVNDEEQKNQPCGKMKPIPAPRKLTDSQVTEIYANIPKTNIKSNEQPIIVTRKAPPPPIRSNSSITIQSNKSEVQKQELVMTSQNQHLQKDFLQQNHGKINNSGKTDDYNIYQPIWKFKTVGIPRDESCQSISSDITEYANESYHDQNEWETDDEFYFTTESPTKVNESNNNIKGIVDHNFKDNSYSNNNNNNNNNNNSNSNNNSDKETNIPDVTDRTSFKSLSASTLTSDKTSGAIKTGNIANKNFSKLNNSPYRTVYILYSPFNPNLRAFISDDNDIFNYDMSITSSSQLSLNSIKTNESELLSSSPITHTSNSPPLPPPCRYLPGKRKPATRDGSPYPGNNFFIPDSVHSWKFMLLDINYCDDEEDMYISDDEILKLKEIEDLPKTQLSTLSRFKSVSSDNLLDIPAQDKKSIGERFRNKLHRGVFKLNPRQVKETKKNKQVFQQIDSSSLYLDEKKYPIFCATLEEVEKDVCDVNVPKFVVVCTNLIQQKKFITIDGIYRASGNKVAIDEVKKRLTQSSTLDPQLIKDEDIHTITGLLKLFFRELKTPLIPQEFYKQLPDNLVKDESLEEIKKILNRVPQPSKDTLKFVLQHLTMVAHYSSDNRMPPSNLAIIWGPCILFSDTTGPFDIARMNTLTKILIEKYDFIFRDDERLVM